MSELKKCPFCGGKGTYYYQPDLERPELKHCHNVCCDRCAATTGIYVSKEQAIAAWARRARPANEPLTLEQLREMEQHGEGIYVTHADGSPIFRGKQHTAAVLDRIAAFGAMGYHLQAIYGRGLTLAEDDYGKTWLAYRTKPERSENGG